ncbi:SCO4225 family membrane protein [Actinoplanes flavus]|uniref:Phage holin family protein n=1 Tax=Actinoplanes flavus TaxID=2820290 RepID=A0ABS3V0K9_9ACTN|nr:hypothetical protein [Actinoplanes flavus]MBO3744364.1 hypothetical protein [Actinoplanes flavus]
MKIVRWFVGSWLSRIYLALVTAVTLEAVVSLLTWDHEVPNYSDIIPTALTLPGSAIGAILAILPIPYNFWAMWLSSVVVGALANAAALNGLVALVRRLTTKAKGSGAIAAESGPKVGQSGAR